MANPDPHQARLAKAAKSARTRPEPGDLSDLRRCLWLAVDKCSRAIHDAEELDDECRKTIFALTQVSGVYIRLIEAVDLEARLSALEGKS
jgi:hypothetical protein